MKKIFLVIALVGFMFSSCKRNSPLDVLPGGNCLNEINKYSESITAYSASPTPANCKKVQGTLNTLINKCSMFTKEQREEYKRDLKDWDCDDN